MKHTITRERVLEILGRPDLDDDDLDGFLDTANADSHEGVEWLPHYKLAVGILSHMAGYLMGIAERHAAIDPNVGPMIAEAQRLFRLSMMACVVPPDATPETIAAKTAQTDGVMEGLTTKYRQIITEDFDHVPDGRPATRRDRGSPGERQGPHRGGPRRP